MSAANALRAARDAGIGLHVDGVDLVLEASAPPPATVLDLLTRHKADLIVLLRPGDNGWSAEDWQAHFDERAGIAEFDGGLPRPDAKTLAFECCIVEWLNRNFERSPPGRCLACGGGDSAHDALLPHGVEPTGHAWLHSRCWPAWHAGRKADAVGIRAKWRNSPMQSRLPMHLSPRCRARTRKGTPCRSPAVTNGRCRMHGGKSPGAPTGNDNARKHGLYTADAISERRELAALLRSMRGVIEEVDG